jgi:hypothetical protein
MKPCKNCLAEGIDPKGARKLATRADGTLEPGPRCVTHYRAKRKADRLRAHARRTEANFEISGDEYWAIYEWQGGMCLICLKARGIARRLAVDHEHGLCDDHPSENGCVRCIRALLCSRCNQTIGWLDVEALKRAIIVLTEAPARQVLAQMRLA